MKNPNDADTQRNSGLFLGSEPIQDVHHRSAAKTDDDDSGKDKGDDDTGDTDKSDTDLTDTGDSSDGTGDADGKD